METLLRDILSVVRPLIELMVMIVGPVFVVWLSDKLATTLKITGEAKRAEFEAQLRAALHQAALNGLKVAASRYGSHIFDLDGYLRPNAIAQAVKYVQEKNPDTLRSLGVSDSDLVDIIVSKGSALANVALPDKPKPTADRPAAPKR